MRYIPHTAADVSEMLERVGVNSLEDLFVEVPGSVRLKRPLDLPEPVSETELLRELKRLAAKNAPRSARLDPRSPTASRADRSRYSEKLMPRTAPRLPVRIRSTVLQASPSVIARSTP